MADPIQHQTRHTSSASILSRRPDGHGFYYGFLAGDSRQINVACRLSGLLQSRYWYPYVGSARVPGAFLTKDDAEAAAIAWALSNPEQEETP